MSGATYSLEARLSWYGRGIYKNHDVRQGLEFVFVNEVLLEHSCIQLFICYLWLLPQQGWGAGTGTGSRACRAKKYLLTGPLAKTLADLYSVRFKVSLRSETKRTL